MLSRNSYNVIDVEQFLLNLNRLQSTRGRNVLDPNNLCLSRSVSLVSDTTTCRDVSDVHQRESGTLCLSTRRQNVASMAGIKAKASDVRSPPFFSLICMIDILTRAKRANPREIHHNAGERDRERERYEILIKKQPAVSALGKVSARLTGTIPHE